MYSLRTSKNILLHLATRFKRRKKHLNASQKDQLYGALVSLQDALVTKDREKADHLAKKLESVSKINLKKSTFEHIRDFLFALVFALIVAVLIRSMWFDPYEIPTGSMRPTLKEKDRLVVSKTDFGVNVPLKPKHFYFDPNLVKRNSIVIFTGENMDIQDVDTLYFYLFPGKKQYVKRLIGKPGDTLYFYGGLLYGIDKDGNDISTELQPERLSKIDHVPFLRMEGKVITPQFPLQGIYSPILLSQMNQPVAKLTLTPTHKVKGEMLAPDVPDLGDLWGNKNYAQARLLTKDQVKPVTKMDLSQLPEGILYLELTHSPSLSNLKLGRDAMDRYRPMVGTFNSILPLKQVHLEKLFQNLYTARFIVKNGFAYRYGSTPQKAHLIPHLPGVPDGVYEFYYGKPYKVLWQGIAKELPPDHPLSQYDTNRLLTLFNLGIEFNTLFSPENKQISLFPSRFAYFRDGNFYVMGAPLLNKDDPILVNFVEREKEKEGAAPTYSPYLSFVDAGPPYKGDGTLDTAFIKKFGLTIPEKSYLVLGDNYAMSGDSREFGFVPEDNLRGGPLFIFWPPGKRWGIPNQIPYSLLQTPRLIVWALAGLIFLLWLIVRHQRRKLPLKY